MNNKAENLEEIAEFKIEANELLDDAESTLLSLEKGGNFSERYSAIFRVFHSLKGGAGMLGMHALQTHMHQLESNLQACQKLDTLPPHVTSYFLKGVDASKQILSSKEVLFDYSLFKLDSNNSTLTPLQNQKPEPVKNQEPNSDRSRALVIDDEIDIVNILKDLLTDTGFEATGFTSPLEALSHLKTFKPDVVITDYNMPELTGFELLTQIKQIDPDLPVIYISGYLNSIKGFSLQWKSPSVSQM